MAPSFPLRKFPPFLPNAKPAAFGTRVLPVFALMACILIAGGCAKAPKDDPTAKYRTTMEETMPGPYTPRDDGLPLTPAEL